MEQRVSRWIWITILGIALLLRVAALGQSPLAPDEAASAVASLDAARGDGWPATTISPLLLSGNALLFALLGGGTGIARWIPALAGTLLVCIPYLWRRHLGEVEAAVASGMLALSPLVWFASRRVDGTTAATLGAMLLLSCLLLGDGSQESSPRTRSVLLVAGIAIGLTGGPAFYDVLLPGVAAYGFYLWMQRRSLRTLPSKESGRSAGIGLLIAILIGAAFGLRWSGWNGLAEGLAAWLRSWQPAAESGPESWLALTIYEPVTLVLAVLGVGLTFRSRRPLLLALALWVAAGVLLIGIRPAARATDLVAISVPLALLAGETAGELFSTSREVRPWMGLHALLAGLCWVPVLLTATQFAAGTLAVSPWLMGIGAVALLALQVLLAILLTLVISPKWVWRGALLGILTIVGVIQLGFGLSLAFVRSGTPTEPAVNAAGSADLVFLQEMLDDLAVQRGQRRDSLTIALVDREADRSALLRWALRDFHGLAVVKDWPTAAPQVVIIPADAGDEEQPTGVWVGRAFVAAIYYPDRIPLCPPESPRLCREIVAWYLYREVPVALNLAKVNVWVAAPSQP